MNLGKGKGKVRIVISKTIAKEIKDSFREDTPDHRILNTAYLLHSENSVKKYMLF